MAVLQAPLLSPNPAKMREMWNLYLAGNLLKLYRWRGDTAGVAEPASVSIQNTKDLARGPRRRRLCFFDSMLPRD